MSGIVRFGVSLEKELLEKFDILIKEKKYPNRSEAIRDLIRENLVKKEWIEGKEVAGAITLVFDHHKRELVNTLTDVQHDFHILIISGNGAYYGKTQNYSRGGNMPVNSSVCGSNAVPDTQNQSTKKQGLL